MQVQVVAVQARRVVFRVDGAAGGGDAASGGGGAGGVDGRGRVAEASQKAVVLVLVA